MILSVFVFSLLFDVCREQDHTIECQPEVTITEGATVVLPYQINPPCDVSNEVVEWKRNSKIVHKRRKGENDLDGQDTTFTGRTEVFPDEMTNGNLSLKLLNVREDDEGIYIVHYINKDLKCSVTIKVDLNITCPPELTVQEGTDVILSYQTNPPYDVSKKVVEWKWNSKIVHKRRKGDDDLDGQDTTFMNRTEVFPHEMVNGSLSLKILNVSKGDAGTYNVSHIDTGSECSITLKVDENLQNKSTGGIERIVGGVFGVLLLFLLIVGMLIKPWEKWRQRHNICAEVFDSNRRHGRQHRRTSDDVNVAHLLQRDGSAENLPLQEGPRLRLRSSHSQSHMAPDQNDDASEEQRRPQGDDNDENPQPEEDGPAPEDDHRAPAQSDDNDDEEEEPLQAEN